MNKEQIEQKVAELQEQRKQIEIQALASLNFIDGKIAMLRELANDQPGASPAE